MRDRDSIYRDILQGGRRRAEQALMRSDRGRMHAENAHLALLPALFGCADERRHRRYLDIEKPRYVRDCRLPETHEFELFWSELAALLIPLPPEIPFASVSDGPMLAYRDQSLEPLSLVMRIRKRMKAMTDDW